MPFVIRALDKIGGLGWVLPTNSRGLRTIGPRANAQVFANRGEAEAVIKRMASVFSALGVQYSIEPADSSPNNAGDD